MTSLIIIRKFQPSDFPHVIDIENRVFNEHDPYLYVKFYETCSNGFLVAEINGMIAGFVVGYRPSETTGRIFSLAVHPDHQRKGIGAALLKELIHILFQNGARELVLEVRMSNFGAKKFYEKYGFSIYGIKEKYYNDGEAAYLMKLNLNSI